MQGNEVEITKAHVEQAILRYEKGDRPFHYTASKSWFIVRKNTLYPLKYIYALTINKEPSTFHTSVAMAVLQKIRIELIHSPQNENEKFHNRVCNSIDNTVERRSRLKTADKFPKQKVTEVFVFDRNPDVVAEILVRANGYCEECGERAPFQRRKDGSPYLEVHHKIHLSNGGVDTVKNAEALCPNCHRKKHFG